MELRRAVRSHLALEGDLMMDTVLDSDAGVGGQFAPQERNELIGSSDAATFWRLVTCCSRGGPSGPVFQ